MTDSALLPLFVEARRAASATLRDALATEIWDQALRSAIEASMTTPERLLGEGHGVWGHLPASVAVAVSGHESVATTTRTSAAGAALDVLICALDLLDSVEDGDDLATLQALGPAICLNVATALLGLAMRLSLVIAPDGRATTALADTLAQATSGQHVDLASSGGPPLSTEACVEIARSKSGSLAALGLVWGALAVDASSDVVAALIPFGQALGLAAQIDNDLHDAGENSDKKSDIARLAQTVPISLARRVDAQSTLSEAVWATGGIYLAYAIVAAERASASDHLTRLLDMCPDPQRARDILSTLLTTRP